MKCPYVAIWNAFSEYGESIDKELHPEDILQNITDGLTPDQIALEVDAPLEVVEHLICMIPEMMSWRRENLKDNNRRSLPKVDP